MRVLVVEDEPVIAINIQATLLDLGYRPFAAATLAAAADILEHSHVDIALLDVRLPDGDGCSLGHKLVERSIPFALMSGTEILPGMIPVGTPILHKPFGSAELTNLLSNLAEQRDRNDYMAGLKKPRRCDSGE